LRIAILFPALAAVIASLPTPALAQRHVWLVPGTAGMPFEGVRWDRGTGHIIAASGDTILRLNPVTGTREELYRAGPWDDGPAGPGSKVLELVLGEGGAIDFTRSGLIPDQPDGRIYRLTPDGQVRVIAGGGYAGPLGEEPEASADRFCPTDLAAGAQGERFIADAASGRILQLETLDGGGFRLEIRYGPWAGEEGAPGPGYDPDGDDLDELGEEPREYAYQHLDLQHWDPRGRIKPRALAAAPDGSLYLADWSRRGDQRPPWVYRLKPPAEAGGAWQLQGLPAPGMQECRCPPGQDPFPVRKPHRLEVGDDGTVYILGHSLLWAYTPLAGEAAGPQWHCEAIAGPLAPKGVVAAWPSQAAPADELDPSVLRRIRHMAAVPGGGLLLSDGVDGIRFLGPAADAALGERVRAHARARLGGEADRARAVLAGLERQRDAPFGLPLRGLCRAGTVSPRLDTDVLGEIAAFRADPKVLAFRAAMAAQAIRAGGDPGPDPQQRILAQRHVWQVPNTHGTTFGAMAWEPATGTLAAASWWVIWRLDPAQGTRQAVFTIPRTPPAESALAKGPRFLPERKVQALVAEPGGAFQIATGSHLDHHSDQVWRFTPEGEVRLLAGGGALEEAFNCNGLAGGPDGALYVADEAGERVLQLTPGTDGERSRVRCLAEGLESLTGAIALGERGELLLGGDEVLRRLVPAPGPGGGWRMERFPEPGTARCAGVHDPVLGPMHEREMEPAQALVPSRDGGFLLSGACNLWAFHPEPAPAGADPRWRSERIAVSGQHALPGGAWETDPRSTLPIPPDFWCSVRDLAGIPGGALVASGFQYGGIRLIGPPGDGALFAQVRAFRQAEADRDWPRARRILGALLVQRSLAAPEACELPFLALARTGPGGAAPRLGPLPRSLGSFLVRPQVMAFRAGVAAETILAGSDLARAWVAAGCPWDEAPGTAAGTRSATGAKRQRTE
jgi:hypothetical protein